MAFRAFGQLVMRLGSILGIKSSPIYQSSIAFPSAHKFIYKILKYVTQLWQEIHLLTHYINKGIIMLRYLTRRPNKKVTKVDPSVKDSSITQMIDTVELKDRHRTIEDGDLTIEDGDLYKYESESEKITILFQNSQANEPPFSASERIKLTNSVQEIINYVVDAITLCRYEDCLKIFFFQSKLTIPPEQLKNGIKKMYSVLTDPCKIMTFFDVRKRRRIIEQNRASLTARQIPVSPWKSSDYNQTPNQPIIQRAGYPVAVTNEMMLFKTPKRTTICQVFHQLLSNILLDNTDVNAIFYLFQNVYDTSMLTT